MSNMFGSVLITGDAGGLGYIDDSLNRAPKKTFNFCCSCAIPEEKQMEKSMVPQKRPVKMSKPVVQQSPLKDLKFQPFSWNQATITKYTNVETMKKPEFIPHNIRQVCNTPNGFRNVGNADSKSTASTPKGLRNSSNLRGKTPPAMMNNTVRNSPERQRYNETRSVSPDSVYDPYRSNAVNASQSSFG